MKKNASISGNVAGVLGQDPTLPSVAVDIDGETYNLCFDFSAIARVEKLSGQNFLGYLPIAGFTLDTLIGMFFVSMLRDRPEMTIERAARLMAGENILRVGDAVMDVWRQSNPKADEVNKQAPNAASS